MQRTTDPPAHNGPGENIDDERNLKEARPGGQERDISDPQLVRTRCRKFPVHQIEGAHQCIIHDRRPAFGTPHNALYSQSFHQTLYRTACNINMLSIKLSPDFTGTVDLEILCPDSLDFRLEPSITP